MAPGCHLLLLSLRPHGISLDQELGFSSYINQLTRSCYYQFRHLRTVSRSLSHDAAATSVHAFATSRHYRCSSILGGLLFALLTHLDRIGGDLAPSLGDGKTISQIKISEWHFLRKNFRFHGQNFLVIDHDVRICPLFFKMFHNFPACNVVYNHFLTRKTPISENNSLMTRFYLLCSCFRTHPTNTTSQNVGGTDAWTVPHLKIFWGDRPPRSPPLLDRVLRSAARLIGHVPK